LLAPGPGAGCTCMHAIWGLNCQDCQEFKRHVTDRAPTSAPPLPLVKQHSWRLLGACTASPAPKRLSSYPQRSGRETFGDFGSLGGGPGGAKTCNPNFGQLPPISIQHFGNGVNSARLFMAAISRRVVITLGVRRSVSNCLHLRDMLKRGCRRRAVNIRALVEQRPRAHSNHHLLSD
jgi:hypothetical protein